MHQASLLPCQWTADILNFSDIVSWAYKWTIFTWQLTIISSTSPLYAQYLWEWGRRLKTRCEHSPQQCPVQATAEHISLPVGQAVVEQGEKYRQVGHHTKTKSRTWRGVSHLKSKQGRSHAFASVSAWQDCPRLNKLPAPDNYSPGNPHHPR